MYLSANETEYKANVEIDADGYYITFNSDERANPFAVDCEIVEGEGKEIEDAVNNLLQDMVAKKLLKVVEHKTKGRIVVFRGHCSCGCTDKIIKNIIPVMLDTNQHRHGLRFTDTKNKTKDNCSKCQSSLENTFIPEF